MAGTRIDLRELPKGTVVVISGYNRVYGGYVGKLLGKNLTIGRSFSLLEANLPEGKIKIMLDNEGSIPFWKKNQKSKEIREMTVKL